MSKTEKTETPFEKAVTEQVARAEAAVAEYAKLEEKAVAHLVSGIDEGARLGKETLTYGAAVATEWRRFSFDVLKRAVSMGPWNAFASYAVPTPFPGFPGFPGFPSTPAN